MKKQRKQPKLKKAKPATATLENLENRYLLAADIVAFEPANLSTLVDSDTELGADLFRRCQSSRAVKLRFETPSMTR